MKERVEEMELLRGNVEEVDGAIVGAEGTSGSTGVSSASEEEDSDSPDAKSVTSELKSRDPIDNGEGGRGISGGCFGEEESSSDLSNTPRVASVIDRADSTGRT